jgi:diphthamide biosynthesis protein 4
MVPDYYQVLAITPTLANQHAVKAAYRKALLEHHPDKTMCGNTDQAKSPGYTVDEITTAYKILSDPTSRSDYDRRYRVQNHTPIPGIVKAHPGLETIDLDDMDYDDNGALWFRKCRCGNDRAYRITEEQLEKEAEHGEIITGCGGCSLWLKVLFQQADNT